MSKEGVKKSVSLRTTISVLVLLMLAILMVFLTLYKVNFLIGRSLLVVFGNADSTYSGAWFDRDGGLVAKNFVLKPDGADSDATLSFKRIRVDTPGWAWLLGNLSMRKLVADIDHLHVTLSDGTSNAGVDPTLGDLGPFGTDTASPFEAEGCLKDNAWLRSELVDMGLHPGPTTLEYDYRVNNNDLTTQITLSTPGVSKVMLVRREQLPMRVNPFLLDQAQSIAKAERWIVQDEGFVKARNAFCARRDGIDEAQFAARHVESVKRLLATRGLALDDGSMAIYADFVRNGGGLTFGGDYSAALNSDDFYEARASGVAFTQMHGTFERDGKKLAAQWTKFDPRPLAGMDEGLPTYAALLKEQEAIPPNSQTQGRPE